jgi:hypothetical protein
LATAATPIVVATCLAALNYQNMIYMDPIPLLDSFEDPPLQYVIGNLMHVQQKWHARILDVTLSSGVQFALEFYQVRDIFKNKYKCSPSLVFASFVGSLLTGTAVDIHNIAYFNATYHGKFKSSSIRAN